MAPLAGFTALICTRLQDATGNLITGTLNILPTDGNDQPIGTTAGGVGGPIASVFAAPLTLVAGALTNTGAQVVDTSLTGNQHISYRFVFEDATGRPLLTWTGVQPSGPSFDLDNYTPVSNAPLGIVTQGPPGATGSLNVASPVTNPVTFQGPVSASSLSVNGAMRICCANMGGWAYALVDSANGRVLQYQKSDGTTFGYTATPPTGSGGSPVQLASGVTTDGTNQTFPGNIVTLGEVLTPTRVPLYANMAGATGGTLDGTGKRFLEALDTTGAVLPQPGSVPVTTTVASTPLQRYPFDAAALTTALNHLLLYGESLAVAPDSSPALSTTASTTAKMFSTGPNATTKGTTNTLTALVESGVETSCSGFAGMLAARLAPKYLSHTPLLSIAAHSGYTYAQIAGPTTAGGSGTAPFQELMAQVSTGKALAPSTYAPRFVRLDLGINDQNAGTTPTQYATDLLTLQSDIQAGVAAITGVSANIPMGYEECQYALGLVESQVCAANPDTHIMVVPGYQLDHHTAAEIASIPSIGVHLSNYGQRNKGEYTALAYERVVLQGSRWTVPHPLNITVVGNTVQVNYATDTQIAIDTSLTGARPHNGFAFSDTAGTTITGVAVTGFAQVTLTLSRAPSPTGRTLSYAMVDETGAYADGQGPGGQQGPLYGRGGNVRNTSTVLSTYTDRNGNHTYMHLYGAKFSTTI